MKFLLCCFCVIFVGQLAFAQTTGQVRTPDGAILHYTVSGRGDPVLLLSGGPGISSDYLRPVAEALDKAYQCILLDQRGTGKSRLDMISEKTINLSLAVSDIEALRAHLKIERLSLLGHSWGGVLAMAYAANHPDRIHKLILVSSGGINGAYSRYLQANIMMRLYPQEKDVLAQWTDSSRRGQNPEKAALEMVKALLPAYVFDRKYVPQIAAGTTSESFNYRVNELMNSDLHKLNYDFRERLKRFERPVLIIQGRQDFVGESTAWVTHQTIPNSRLEFTEECGHFPWIEQEKNFFSTVTDFLINRTIER